MSEPGHSAGHMVRYVSRKGRNPRYLERLLKGHPGGLVVVALEVPNWMDCVEKAGKVERTIDSHGRSN